MNAVATELRQLASRLEQTTRESSVASIAWEVVRPVLDNLALRARLLELEARSREESRASEPRRGAGG